MKQISIYLNFIREKGRPLSEINPGSSEMALTVNETLQAIDLLKGSQIVIFGGDILTEENNKLIYAYQLWGDKYIYLNWYCEKTDTESQIDYANRSYNMAKERIQAAHEIAKHLKKKCLIVLVI